MSTYYLQHEYTKSTRCDNCGKTFTWALLNEADCEPSA